MFDVVLHRPEIPPNTGNVIRLCANTGARLHLIEPLGFAMDDAKLRRAGLDYHEWACVQCWPGLTTYLEARAPRRLFAVSTRGTVRYDQPRFAPDDAFLFGSETSGLPAEVLAILPVERILRLPMQPGGRSLNLSNCVAVVVYRAWQQLGFAGGG